MIRQPARRATATEADEDSMRVVEYALALLAVIAAGMLAFIR